MKVIGLSKDGFILDADRDEVARLSGYYGTYDFMENEGTSIEELMGKEIRVSEIYQQLYELQRKHNEIETAKEKLAQCIKLIELVEPVIDVKVK